MAAIDIMYHNLMEDILNKGYDYLDPNRKKQGVHRRQINKFNFDYDMKKGFPAITTKKLAWKSVVGETLWILRGQTSIKPLVDKGIPIWNKDAYNFHRREVEGHITLKEFVEGVKKGEYSGNVGKNYGYQLRNWEGDVDQLQNIVDTLKHNPMATKKVVTYWNPAEKESTALTPCHRSWEVLVRPLTEEERYNLLSEENKRRFDLKPSDRTHEKLDYLVLPKYELSLSFDMSSVDVFLGLPFNIASYAIILRLLAYATNMTVGTLSGNLTNVHIYVPHFEAVYTQLNRRDMFYYSAPTFELHPIFIAALGMGDDIDEGLNFLDNEDFKLDNYQSYDKIVAPMLAYDE